MTTAPDWDSQTSADVFATALIGQMHTDAPSLGLQGYHHDFGDSEALRSGLLRLWQHYQDQITKFLAKEAEASPRPRCGSAPSCARSRCSSCAAL